MSPTYVLDHEHSHVHSHAPKITDKDLRRVLIGMILIGGFMLIEVIGGLYSRFLALLTVLLIVESACNVFLDSGHILLQDTPTSS